MKTPSMGERFTALAMAAGLLAGAPAAAVAHGRDPAKQAYAAVLRDLLKANDKSKHYEGGTREPFEWNPGRQYRRAVSEVFQHVTGYPMTPRQWRVFRTVLARRAVATSQIGMRAVRFLDALEQVGKLAAERDAAAKAADAKETPA